MKTVHIVGMGLGWGLCPYEGEIWTVNRSCLFRKSSLIFYVDRGLLKDTDKNDPEAVAFLEKCISNDLDSLERVEDVVMRVVKEEGSPVITTREFDDIPECIAYPLGEIVEKYGCDCFGNSTDFMVAYALYMGYTDINLYGINMDKDNQRGYEKAPLSFWLGMAMGDGCKITIHGKISELLVTDTGYIYGYGKKQWIQRDKGMQRKL